MPNEGPPWPAKGRPRCVEAGRKAGAANKAKRDPEFFKEIGKKGGQATKERHGEAHFSAIGKKGGEIRKEQIGRDGYAEIGAVGGHNGRGRKRKSAE